MKRTSILFCLLFAITANSFTAAKAQAVNVQDSLALVDLYNSTNGPNWTYHDNWLSGPVSTWYGITVTGTRVTEINLQVNNVNGPLPASIGNLTEMTGMFILYNNLTGPIPSSIGNMIKLNSLSLHNNHLSGSIPSSLGNLTSLQGLSLDNNDLSGTIPSSLYSLPTLFGLYLHHNHLKGKLSSSVGNLTQLTFLEIDHNQLTGTIPDAIGKLTNIYQLNLNNNHFTGDVPASFNKLRNAYKIDISYNQLTESKDVNFNQDESKLNLLINNNHLTFNALESIAKHIPKAKYAPQAIIPVQQNGNTLLVSAGGTLSNNTYNWHKAGEVGSSTITGDSTFTPSQSGRYYVAVTNKVATQLTLYSDTIDYTLPEMKQNNLIASSEKNASNHFSIYPNPATNMIHIQTNGTATIVLTNSAGKILLTKTINNTDVINVSAFANDVYYIQNKTTGETEKVLVIH